MFLAASFGYTLTGAALALLLHGALRLDTKGQVEVCVVSPCRLDGVGNARGMVLGSMEKKGYTGVFPM